MIGGATDYPAISPEQPEGRRGYYKAEGFDVEIIAPANPADPIKLVARERVNFSLTYVPEVLMSRDTGIPVIAVATTLRKIVSGFTSLDESGISSATDLQGKVIGQNVKMDAQAYLDTVLTSGGLSRKDVKIIDPGYAGISLALAGKIHAELLSKVVYGLIMRRRDPGVLHLRI